MPPKVSGWMREKLSEFVCAVVLIVLRQSAATKSVRENLVDLFTLFIDVSLLDLYTI